MGDFKGLLNIANEKITKNSPEILIGMGLAGMLSTTILACKVAPKVNSIIEEEKENRRLENEPEMTRMDKVKLSWKPYLPVAIGYSLSAACILGANSINSRRHATLLTAYKIGEKALIEYKDKVVEIIGEDKEKEIRDSISRDRLKKEPINHSEIIFTGKGESLCYDMISGRYFKCDVDKINKAVNELNFRMLSDMYVSVNDFYELIGLDCIASGFEMGWNIDDGKVDVYFSAQLTDDDQPCIVINHNNFPKHEYDRLK